MLKKKCTGPLVEMTTAEGVTVDFCSDCKGILFDPGEVAFYFELSQDIPELAREGAKKTGQQWQCPKHPQGKLIEYVFPKLDNLMLDFCDHAGCIWFDRGEVYKFEQLTARLESPRSRFIRVFATLESQGYQIMGVNKS